MNIRKLFIPLAAIAVIVGCKKAEPAYMTLSDKSLTVEAIETSAEFSVSANTYYRVNNDITWATLATKEVVGDKTTFVLTFDQNTSYDARTSTIRFIGDNVTPLKFYFTQEGAIPEGVYPDNFEVNCIDTEVTTTVLGTIRSEKLAWSIGKDSKHPEFVAVPASGTGEADVKINFPENNAEDDITAVLPVKIGEKNYTLTIVQKGKKFIDLSAGGTSNTYMINKSGLYKFKATVRGTGVVPESYKGEISAEISPASVGVLWSTYNTAKAPESDDAIIKYSVFEDGYFKFMTDLTKLDVSNVIIAAKDASGIILWTWHLWLTEEPGLINVNGSLFQDRNLGATAPSSEDARACGFLYQWGRKDPFRTSSSLTSLKNIATLPELSDEDASILSTEVTGTTMASINNPRAFLYTDGKNRDWLFVAGHDDRWEDSKKTMFDPCPQGYKVPKQTQYSELVKAGLPGYTDGSYKGQDYKDALTKGNGWGVVTDVWILMRCGYLSWNSGVLTDLGVTSRLPSSTFVAENSNAFYLNGNGSAINATNKGTRAHGGAVRCVKE